MVATAHRLATEAEGLLTARNLNPAVFVINPDCVHVDFDAFAGIPLSWLTGPIQSAGWHISTDAIVRGRCSIKIEPMAQTPQNIPDRLFHATWKANLPDIRKDGIVPQSKATTWTKRTYPTLRSFYAVSKWDAFVYIASHMCKGPVPYALPALTTGTLDKWEILAVSNVTAHNFYHDSIMLPSVWTDTVIPPASLMRVKGWRNEYRQGVKLGQASLFKL